jgi:hypothetical protein
MTLDHGNDAYVPGPLDELFPGLRRKAEKLEALPVHPRVVRLPRQDGTRTIGLLSFGPAHSARALHAGLKPLLEAALLSELCAAPAELAAGYQRLSELSLLMYVAQPFEVGPALSPFALEPVAAAAGEYAQLLALARREALSLAQPLTDDPCAVYRARVLRSEHPLASALHGALLQCGPHSAWGREPGRLARTLADWLATQGQPELAPTRAGIERLEAIVVQRGTGVIRWIEPLIFQALCDLIAVMAASQPGLDVEWGVCDPDPESGLSPPPVLRVQRGGDAFHVPLAEHVLRWCVMPVAPGESVPTLGAWAEHEFA